MDNQVMNTFNNIDVFYLSNMQDYSINQLFLINKN